MFPSFVYKLVIDKKECFIGKGGSVKKAQQHAAQQAWSALQGQSDWSSQVFSVISLYSTLRLSCSICYIYPEQTVGFPVTFRKPLRPRIQCKPHRPPRRALRKALAQKDNSETGVMLTMAKSNTLSVLCGSPGRQNKEIRRHLPVNGLFLKQIRILKRTRCVTPQSTVFMFMSLAGLCDKL